MAIIVPISGVQGSGKSTLQNALAEIQTPNISIYSDTYKVSRAVQNRLGVASLSDVISSVESFTNFQDAILREKDKSLSLLKSAAHDVVITERSFIDIAAYHNIWALQFYDRGAYTLSEVNDKISSYTDKCIKLQNYHFASNIIVPKNSAIVFEYDPNRADEELSDQFFEQYMSILEKTNQSAFIISTQSVAERVAEAVSFLERMVTNV